MIFDQIWLPKEQDQNIPQRCQEKISDFVKILFALKFDFGFQLKILCKCRKYFAKDLVKKDCV